MVVYPLLRGLGTNKGIFFFQELMASWNSMIVKKQGRPKYQDALWRCQFSWTIWIRYSTDFVNLMARDRI